MGPQNKRSCSSIIFSHIYEGGGGGGGGFRFGCKRWYTMYMEIMDLSCVNTGIYIKMMFLHHACMEISVRIDTCMQWICTYMHKCFKFMQSSKLYVIMTTNWFRREFVPGSLYAEADHFLQPKVIGPDQLLQRIVIRINYCVTGFGTSTSVVAISVAILPQLLILQT